MEKIAVTADPAFDLSSITVKPYFTDPDEWGIAGFQMGFNNGVESPMIQVVDHEHNLLNKERTFAINPRL